MKQEIINGGNARYLGELERFKDGIPFGIVNKTKTDVGGTYVAANCSSNYIIVCPFKDLVDSIAADKNNRYGGTQMLWWCKRIPVQEIYQKQYHI